MSTRSPLNGTPSDSSSRRWRAPLASEPSARTIRCHGTSGSSHSASTAPATPRATPTPAVRSASIRQLGQWDKSGESEDRLSQALGDKDGEVSALIKLSHVTADSGRLVEARSLIERAVAVAQFGGAPIFDHWPAWARQPSFLGIPELATFGSPTCSDWVFVRERDALKCGPGTSRRSHTADEYVGTPSALYAAA